MAFRGLSAIPKVSCGCSIRRRACRRGTRTVLIQGETGTGKELVARAIHHNSRRSSRPFVPSIAVQSPRDLVESELFGYVRGAFTGALSNKSGRFEAADGGTIFLDEVGELAARGPGQAPACVAGGRSDISWARIRRSKWMFGSIAATHRGPVGNDGGRRPFAKTLLSPRRGSVKGALRCGNGEKISRN